MPETKWDGHDPQGQDEDAEDDHHHRHVVRGVLDALLPAGNLVLVPAGDAEGDPGVHSPHPLRLREPQHLLRSGHLRLVHALLPCRPGTLPALLPPSGRLPALAGPPVRPSRTPQRGAGVGRPQCEMPGVDFILHDYGYK